MYITQKWCHHYIIINGDIAGGVIKLSVNSESCSWNQRACVIMHSTWSSMCLKLGHKWIITTVCILVAALQILLGKTHPPAAHKHISCWDTRGYQCAQCSVSTQYTVLCVYMHVYVYVCLRFASKIYPTSDILPHMIILRQYYILATGQGYCSAICLQRVQEGED